MAKREKYDVIIIGAGMGGLHSGIYLQGKNPGLRTIILEKNNYPGGYVSGFSSKGFYFDSAAETILDYINSNSSKTLKEFDFTHPFIRLNPTEAYMKDDKTLNLFSNKKEFLDEIAKYYPAQVDGVKNLLKTCDKIKHDIWDCGLAYEKITLGKVLKVIFKYPTLRKYARKTAQDLLDDFISKELQEYFSLFSLWFGLELHELTAPVLADIISGNFNSGMYYPKGGMDTFARKLVDFYRQRGGELKYKAKVDRIIIKGKKVQGIQLTDGTILKSSYIIANSDLYKTINQYVGRDYFKKKYLKYIDGLRTSITGFMLYLGVEDIDLSNYPPHFIIGDISKIITKYRQKEICLDNIGVRIAANIDSDLRNGNKDSITVLGFAPFGWNNNWLLKNGSRRTKEYRALKREITEELIKRVETIIPNLSKHIKLKRLATPKTFEKFNLSKRGSWYGPEFNQKLPDFRSPIRNLFFAGSNVGGSGVNAAMSSGIITAKHVLKRIERDYVKGLFLPVISSKSHTPQ